MLHLTVLTQTMKECLPPCTLRKSLRSIMYFQSVSLHPQVLFSSQTRLQVISCLTCSPRPKKCCCLVNAEYWLIRGGVGGGVWKALELKCKSLRHSCHGCHKRTPLSLTLWQLKLSLQQGQAAFLRNGSSSQGFNFKSSSEAWLQAAPTSPFLRLPWSQIKFTLPCLQKYPLLIVCKSRNENTLYLKLDKEWVSIKCFFFLNKWWVITSS